jgi:hypothetical protein
MLALGKIFLERSGRPVTRPVCRPRLACRVGFEKPMSIIGVVEDEKPLSVPLISQPVVNELKYVRLRVPPARDLDVICDVAKALLETGSIARVYPEKPMSPAKGGVRGWRWWYIWPIWIGAVVSIGELWPALAYHAAGGSQ